MPENEGSHVSDPTGGAVLGVAIGLTLIFVALFAAGIYWFDMGDDADQRGRTPLLQQEAER